MSDRDRFPSYLQEALSLIEHYINYRGRTYGDLKAIHDELHELQFKVYRREIKDFSHISEVAEALAKIKD